MRAVAASVVLALAVGLHTVEPTIAQTNAARQNIAPPKEKAARHKAVTDWPRLPNGFVLGQPSGVGVDSHDNVFVFHRVERTWTTPFPTNPIPDATVLLLDGRSGQLLASWGKELFIMPHGLTVGHDDNVWLTDVGRHQVFKFTHDGKLLLTLGERGKPGADQNHFNLPSDVAVLPDGSFYVSDGYRNTRVVKFSADGRYEFEWGKKGVAPGEFNLPHGVAVDARGRVYVCDRSNARLQVFDPHGQFLAEWKGKHIGRPYGVSVGPGGHVFIADGGNAPGATAGSRGIELDADGNALDTFGWDGPEHLRLAHDIAVGKDGSVYVADSGARRVVKFVKR
jgi:peptidylamidoglycolate lyase